MSAAASFATRVVQAGRGPDRLARAVRYLRLLYGALAVLGALGLLLAAAGRAGLLHEGSWITVPGIEGTLLPLLAAAGVAWLALSVWLLPRAPRAIALVNALVVTAATVRVEVSELGMKLDVQSFFLLPLAWLGVLLVVTARRR